jgi:transposase InsO family protein
VIVHSDRGSQYCSKRFQRLIEKPGLLCSMSKRGDCYDNACAESFFHSFKIELTHGMRYSTRLKLRREAFQYIETYYNVVRRHSALGYVSPARFGRGGELVSTSLDFLVRHTNVCTLRRAGG